MSRIAEKLKSQHLKNAGWKISEPLVFQDTQTITLAPTYENTSVVEVSQAEMDRKLAEQKAQYMLDAMPTVTCSWGELLDVLVSVNAARVQTVNGRTYIDLRAEEAFKLAQQLIQAAYEAMRLDRDYADQVIKDVETAAAYKSL